jgi:hypothetical protein
MKPSSDYSKINKCKLNFTTTNNFNRRTFTDDDEAKISSRAFAMSRSHLSTDVTSPVPPSEC